MLRDRDPKAVRFRFGIASCHIPKLRRNQPAFETGFIARSGQRVGHDEGLRYSTWPVECGQVNGHRGFTSALLHVKRARSGGLAIAMKLHGKTREALKKKLIEDLPKVMVVNESSVDWATVNSIRDIDSVASFSAEERDWLIAAIGEKPIFNFIMHVMDQRLSSNFHIDTATPRSFLDLFHLDASAYAEELVVAFSNLPTRYVIFSPLTAALSDDLSIVERHYPISEGSYLSTYGPEHEGFFPGLSEGIRHSVPVNSIATYGTLATLGQTPNPPDAIGRRFLQFEVSGLIDRYSTFGTPQDCVDYVKTFYGLGRVLGLFEVSIAASLFAAPNPYSHLVTYFADKEYSKASFYVRMEDAAGSFITKLRLASNIRDLSTPERVAKVYADLEKIRRVLSSGSRGETIRRAARWYLDSFVGSNELLAYVQAAVCMEILFGEDKYAGTLSINDVISNRCAYLIGRDHKEREDIIAAFKEIYRVRSLIVHKGKSRLAQSDRGRFGQLRHICERSIAAEIDLLRV